MNVKALIFTVIENIIKIIILAVVVMYIFRGITYAYDFGYRVFADEPVSANTERIVTVGVTESNDINDIAKMLEDKGLIKDSRLFVIQEYLSSYHDMIKPGIYDLSPSMTANEMIQIMATEVEQDSISQQTVPEEGADELDGDQTDGSVSDESAGEESEDIYVDGVLLEEETVSE